MRWLAEEELWLLGTRAEAHTGRPMEMGCLPATRRGWRSRGRLGFQLWEQLGCQVCGEGLNESLRTLELPNLTECSALEFGDWMAVITPLMSDLNSTSATWWELTVNTRRGWLRRWTDFDSKFNQTQKAEGTQEQNNEL